MCLELARGGIDFIDLVGHERARLKLERDGVADHNLRWVDGAHIYERPHGKLRLHRSGKHGIRGESDQANPRKRYDQCGDQRKQHRQYRVPNPSQHLPHHLVPSRQGRGAGSKTTPTIRHTGFISYSPPPHTLSTLCVGSFSKLSGSFYARNAAPPLTISDWCTRFL